MNRTGTRLVCDQCGAQVMVTKGGDGQVICDGVPMRDATAPAREATSARPSNSVHGQ